MGTIFVYTEQDTSPRFLEVIKEIKKYTGTNARIYPVTAQSVKDLPRFTPVVVFGKVEDPEYTHYNNIYTYSVAQVLTKANALTVVSSAFARALGNTPELPNGPTNVVTYSMAPWVIPIEMDYEGYVVVDIETSGNIRTGTVDDDDVRLLTVAFYFPVLDSAYVYKCNWYGGFEGAEAALANYFRNSEAKFIWHNGKFDVRVISRLLGVTPRIDHDTMLMHHALNQAAGNHKLKDLCQLYLGAPEWEQDLKKYTKGGGHYELIPFNLLAKYNAYDVYWTWQLFSYLKPQLDADEAVQNAYKLELAASEFLLKVEQRGIPFDAEAAGKLEDECEAAKLLAYQALENIVGKGFNPNSPKQVKEYLHSAGYKVAKTDVVTIEELQTTLEEDSVVGLFCEALLGYRKHAKISSTYVKGWKSRERNGRVHPTFLIHGTSTGRLSSTSPNSQNVPRDKKVRAIVGL